MKISQAFWFDSRYALFFSSFKQGRNLFVRVLVTDYELRQIDEHETFHHTKCKPLSVVLVVNEKHKLLEAKVAEMPAKGKLATFSRKKYGHRKDERKQKLAEALQSVKERLVDPPILIQSDANPLYPNQVGRYFSGVNPVKMIFPFFYARPGIFFNLMYIIHKRHQKITDGLLPAEVFFLFRSIINRPTNSGSV